MSRKKTTIAVVAPGGPIKPETAERVRAIAARLYPDGWVELRVHPQCFLAAGHFAGDDAARSAAFLEAANDPLVDAVWFARGGYGACRLADDVYAKLNDAARKKAYLGYSDAGVVLARLYREGIGAPAHGPMVADIEREGGEAAIARALSWLVARDPAGLEPSVRAGEKCAAFNITILSHILGTSALPDLSHHVLMLEEVAEYMYRIDRSFFQITSHPDLRNVAGVRLGRCSEIPENDPDFGQTEEEVAQYWCARNGIAWLGRADIGHDADNKIVPFGAPASA
ncbi:MAG: LD-carboxypeptidase [Parvularculaceae bacterium]